MKVNNPVITVKDIRSLIDEIYSKWTLEKYQYFFNDFKYHFNFDPKSVMWDNIRDETNISKLYQYYNWIKQYETWVKQHKIKKAAK